MEREAAAAFDPDRNSPMTPSQLRLGLVVTVLGFLAGLWWLVDTALFTSRAATAPGVVTRVRRQGRGTGQRASGYFPTVRFRAADGQEHEFESAYGSDPPAYRVRDTVRVLYDPRDPRRAELAGWNWAWPLLLVCVTAGLSGGLLFWLRRV